MKSNHINKVCIGLLVITFISCNSQLKRKPTESSLIRMSDTLKSKSTEDIKRKVIDNLMEKGNRPDDEQDTPSSTEERRRVLKSYDEIKIVDTTLINGDDSIRLHLKYFCLKDEILVIPKSYVFDKNNPRDFITHDFASNILLIHKSDTIFKKTIRKNDFNSIIADQLIKFGTLRMPNLSASNMDKSQIVLVYSISIPMTEIGTSVSFIINKKGDFKIAKE